MARHYFQTSNNSACLRLLDHERDYASIETTMHTSNVKEGKRDRGIEKDGRAREREREKKKR